MKNIRELIGNAVPNIKSLDEIKREGKYLAAINQNKCIKCGKCLVCIYNAVEKYKEQITINDNKCNGCKVNNKRVYKYFNLIRF